MRIRIGVKTQCMTQANDPKYAALFLFICVNFYYGLVFCKGEFILVGVHNNNNGYFFFSKGKISSKCDLISFIFAVLLNE